jgi:hypothetical protein
VAAQIANTAPDASTEVIDRGIRPRDFRFCIASAATGTEPVTITKERIAPPILKKTASGGGVGIDVSPQYDEVDLPIRAYPRLLRRYRNQHGLWKMSEVPGLGHSALTTARNLLRAKTLHAANDAISNATSKLAEQALETLAVVARSSNARSWHSGHRRGHGGR